MSTLPSDMQKQRPRKQAPGEDIPVWVVVKEMPGLEAFCRAIEMLTVYAVVLHTNHKAFVVYCSGRKGAERKVPKEWCGYPVVRRMGKPEGE